MHPVGPADNSSLVSIPPIIGAPRWEGRRVLDITVALCALVPTAVVAPLIALAIRLDSPGPVLYAQERLGRHGRPFRCFKFRTMHLGCDDTTWTVAHDGRVTCVGRFLRRAHLDELPQLWNVLRGDMAIVGPRPLRHSAACELGILDHPRFSVRPGLTGWAQVNHICPQTAVEQLAKFEFDADYVRRRSLWLDLRILLWTAWILVRMKGI